MMLMSWLISDSKTSPCGEYKDNSNYLLKVAAHTLITKSLLYGSAVLFSTIFVLLFFCSTVAWLAIQAVWFVCCIEADELKLSTEACDSLESELVHQDMKRAVDVQSDWVTVAVKTSSGLECTMRLHSIICVSGSDKMPSSSSCRSDANARKVDWVESSHNAYDPPIKKKTPNTQGTVSGKRTNMEEKVKEDVKPSKPVLFWLHGAGGSAILSFGISGIIDRLVDDYDIYALDLPGFGRSTIEWPGKDSLNNATVDDVCELFTEAFAIYLKIKGLKDVYLVGHSFGAYHAINFAEKYPASINRLLVIDPGGMFPIQCKEGAFMAILFKWGIPMFFLRSLGSPGFQIYRTFLKIRAHLFPDGVWGKKGALLLSYWYQVQAAQDGVGDILIGKFFDVGYFAACGLSPAYKRFLNLKMPVAIGYGEKDKITPPHQGLILSGLCGSTVPVYMISDAGHLPMRKQNGIDFVTLINHAYARARHIKEDSAGFCESLPVTEGGEMYGSDARSYYSTECTLKNMTDFYHSILTKRRQSLSENSDCLPCPYVANIDGEEVTMSGHHFPINEKAIQSTIDRHFFQPGKYY